MLLFPVLFCVFTIVTARRRFSYFCDERMNICQPCLTEFCRRNTDGILYNSVRACVTGGICRFAYVFPEEHPKYIPLKKVKTKTRPAVRPRKTTKSRPRTRPTTARPRPTTRRATPPPVTTTRRTRPTTITTTTKRKPIVTTPRPTKPTTVEPTTKLAPTTQNIIKTTKVTTVSPKTTNIPLKTTIKVTLPKSDVPPKTTTPKRAEAPSPPKSTPSKIPEIQPNPTEVRPKLGESLDGPIQTKERQAVRKVAKVVATKPITRTIQQTTKSREDANSTITVSAVSPTPKAETAMLYNVTESAAAIVSGNNLYYCDETIGSCRTCQEDICPLGQVLYRDHVICSKNSNCTTDQLF